MQTTAFLPKRWHKTASFLVTLALVLGTSFPYIMSVTERASAATATVENLLSDGAVLDGYADRIPVFKISVSGEATENLTSFKVRLVGSGGANFTEGQPSSSILSNLQNASDVSGIGVYADSMIAGTPGSPDWEDTPITFNSLPSYSSNTVTLSLGLRPLNPSGAIYFITVKPKETGLTNGESFTIGMNNGDIFTSVAGPTFSNVTTGALTVSAAPRITKIMAFESDGTTPVGNGTLTSGKKLDVIFSVSMGTPGNIDSLFWAYNPDNYSGRSFGTSASVALRTTYTSNDTYRITLGTSPTVVDGDVISFSGQDASGNWVSDFLNVDITGPTLLSVMLINDAGTDNQATQLGDSLEFTFSEPINQDTINSANINTTLPATAGTFKSNPSATLQWLSDNVLKVTLEGNVTNTVGATVNPSSTVRDLAENPDATVAPGPTVTVASVQPVTNIVLNDGDSTQPGIDNNDIQISWTPSSSTSTFIRYDVYLLPDGVALDSTSHARINSNLITNISTGMFNGTDSTYPLSMDSRFNYASAMTSTMYYPLDPGTQYVAYVCTVANDATQVCRSSQPTQFNDEFYSVGADNPMVERASPMWGEKVAPNIKTINVKFNQDMDSSTILASSLALRRNDSLSPINISAATYNANTDVATFAIGETLETSKTYEYTVASSIRSAGSNLPLSGNFVGEFNTDSVPDSGAPVISWKSVTNGDPGENLGNVNTYSPIEVLFGESMNPTTISSSTVALFPAVVGTVIEYDPTTWGLQIRFDGDSMLADMPYTLTLTTGIQDNYGNALASNDVTLFRTVPANQVDNSAPNITWCDSDGYKVWVGFDQTMKSSSVLEKSYWTMSTGTSFTSLTGATFRYNDMYNELEIEGVNMTQDSQATLSANANVKGVNNASLATSTCTFESRMSYDNYTDMTYYDAGKEYNYGMSSDGTWDTNDGDMQNFTPVMVWPEVAMEGATTSYYVSFPTNQSIPIGGQIILEFPAGTGLSLVTMRANSWANEDINGGNTGTVTATIANADNVNKTVTLTTVGAATTELDYIMFELDGIINPQSSTRDWETGEGGYTVTINTKSNTGAWLQQDLVSNYYEIMEAGTGTITATVLDNSTLLPVSGATVVCDNYLVGWQQDITDVSGVASFSALPTDNREYWCHVDAAPDGYMAEWNDVRVNLSDSAPNGTATFYIKPAPYTISGTITHTGIGASGTTQAEVWASSNQGWMNKEITLDNDGSTTYTLSVTEGDWEVGLNPFFGNMTMGYANYSDMEFQSVYGGRVSVNATTSPVTVNMTLVAANLTITGTVLDQTGAGLPNVEVYAFSQETKADSHAMSSSDGSFTLKVAEGTYQVGVWAQGAIPPPEESMIVTEAGNTPATLSFVVTKGTNQIAGTVTGKDGDPIQYASVWAYNDDGIQLFTNTNNSGEYAVFVSAGTWYLNVDAPGYGLVCSETVTVTSGDVTQDCAYDATNFATISGTVVDSNGNGMPNVDVFAETYNSITKQMGNGGKFGHAFTDYDGSFAITMQKNGDSERIRIGAHSWQYGEATRTENLDLRSANSTGNTITFPRTYAVTVNVSSVPSGCDTVWVDAFNSTTWTWNGKDIRNITTGSGSAALQLSDGTWEIKTWACSLDNATSTVVSGSAKTVAIDLSVQTTFTASGTVTSGGTAVADASVDFFNPSNGRVESVNTAVDGTFSKVLREGGWDVTAYKKGYSRSEPDRINGSSATATLVLEAADSSLSGTVEDSDGDPVAYAMVWAESSDGAFSADSTGATGTFSFSVASGKTWTVHAGADGYEGEVSNVASGATGITITLDQSIKGWRNMPPANNTFNASDATTTSNDSFKVAIPAKSMGDATNVKLVAKEIKAPNTQTMKVVGGAFDISIQNQVNNEKISTLTQAAEVTLVLTKSMLEEMIDAQEVTINSTRDDLEKMAISYFDTASSTWKSAEKTTIASVTLINSLGVETTVGFDTFKENLESDNYYYTDDPDDSTDTPLYTDYEMDVTASTTHFSIYGITFPSDSTAPSAPSSLTATAGNATVTLDWANNSETDLLEYEVYRSTTSGFTPSNSNQLNSSQLTTSAYTDSTVTNGTTYYYKVSAVDSAGNESSFASVSSTPTAGSPTINASPTAGGNPLSSPNTSPSVTAEEEETAVEEVSPETAVPSTVFEAVVTLTDTVGHWAESYITELFDSGVVQGYSDGTFGPDKEINRAELTKIVLEAFGIETSAVTADPFSDVPADAWFAPYVSAAKELLIVEGYTDDTFKPGQSITRAEALKIVIEAAGLAISDDYTSDSSFSDVSEDAWYAKYVLYAEDSGFVQGYGDGTFKPDQKITRAEFAKITVKVQSGLVSQPTALESNDSVFSQFLKNVRTLVGIES